MMMFLKRRRWQWVLIVVSVWVSLSVWMPVAAQTDSSNTFTVGETVGGVLVDGESEWTLVADANTILELTARRIGGVYDMEIQLRDPNGAPVAISETAENSVSLRVDDGLPMSGEYRVFLKASNEESDGLNVVSEYSLTATSRGQVRADINADLPAFFAAAIVPVIEDRDIFFSPDLITPAPIPIGIYGAVTVEQVGSVGAATFTISRGDSSLTINNAPAVGTLINAATITEGGSVVVRTVTGSLFITSRSVIALGVASANSRTLTFTLDDGRAITTDFIGIQQLSTTDTLVELALAVPDNPDEADSFQPRIVLDSDVTTITTTGGILSISADEASIRTDGTGWDVLALRNDEVIARYDGNMRVRSEVLSVDFFRAERAEDEDSSTPDTIDSNNSAAARYRFVVNTFGRPISTLFDTRGVGEIGITATEYAVTMLDGRAYSEDLFTLETVTLDNRALRILRTDGTAQFIAPDDVGFDTAAALPPVDDAALPHEAGFVPQHFNNLGTTVSDYHPHWDTDGSVLPVNRANGNLVYQVQDISIIGQGATLDWTRTYNSLRGETAVPYYAEAGGMPTLGAGWTHSYQYALDLTYALRETTPQVRLILPDGSQHIFQRGEAGYFESDILLSWRVEQLAFPLGAGEGGWQASNTDGMIYTFDSIGRLTSISDPVRGQLIFSPIPQARLAAYGAVGGVFVTDSYGRRIEIYADELNRIIAVRDVQGRDLRYGYTDGLLTTVRYRGGEQEALYVYDANGRLTDITDPHSPYHQRMTVDYDERGRVAGWVYNPNGDLSTQRQITLEYATNPDEFERYLVTQTLDNTPRSNRNAASSTDVIQTWSFDSTYRMLSATPDAAVGTFDYGYSQTTGLLADIQGPNGASVLPTYDAATGYLLRLADPIGNSFAFTYDVLDDGRVLLRQVDAVGGGDFSIIGWRRYDYNAEGLLAQMTQRLEEESFATIVTEYDYDNDDRLALITVSDGSPDRFARAYTYDAFGYVSSLTVDTEATLNDLRNGGNATPLWQVAITHDITGRLRLVEQERETGRVLQAIQWNDTGSAITEIALTDTSNGERLATGYQYDAFGNLTAITQADGSSTLFAYDALNQMLQVTETLAIDAEGNTDTRVTCYLYDAAGNVLAEYLATDSIGCDSALDDDSLRHYLQTNGVTYRYDNNLLVGVTRGGQESLTFTRDFVAGDGDRTTRYTVTDDAGDTLEYLFDEVGRLEVFGLPRERVAIDEETFENLRPRAYELDYNAFGNLIRVDNRTVQTSRRSVADYNLLNRVLSTSIVGAEGAPPLITRFAYDSLGRLISVTDPDGHLLLSDVDAAGRVESITLPQSIDSANITYEYDAAGNLIVVDAGGVIRRFGYDAANQVISTTRAGNQTSYTYDAVGNLIAVSTDESTIRYGYDAAGRLVGLVDAAGATTDYVYDAQDQVIRVLTPTTETTLTYDPRGNLVALTLPNNREYLYGWDRDGRVTSVTNPLGHTTFFAYDRFGWLARITDAQGATTAFDWTDDGRLQNYSSGDLTLIYTPDNYGRLRTVTGRDDSDENTVVPDRLTISYDARGNVLSVVRGGGSNNERRDLTFGYIYDNNGRLTQYNPPDTDGSYLYDYDGNGNVVQVVDLFGGVWAYTYDGLGNLTSVTAPDGTTDTYNYDAVGNLRQVTTASGLITTYDYDAGNRLIEVNEWLGEIRDDNEPARSYLFAYDVNGNLIRFQDAAGRVTTYAYDLFGNVISITRQGVDLATIEEQDLQAEDIPALTATYSYDAVDNLTGVILPDEATFRMTYNTVGQRVRFIDPGNNTWSYEYDARGNLAEVNNPLGFTTEFQWDSLDRLVSAQYGRGGTETRVSYQRDSLASVTLVNDNRSETIGYPTDVFGNLTAIVHGSQSTDISRDALGRVVGIARPDGTRLALQYDAVGNVVTLTTSVNGSISSAQTRTYDARGHLVQIVSTDSSMPENERSTRFEYDAWGAITTYQVTDEIEMTYRYDTLTGQLLERTGTDTPRYNMDLSYDGFDRVASVNFADAANFAVAYDEGSRRSRVIRSNGVETRYTYNPRGFVQSILHLDSSLENPLLRGFEYTYDAVGNVVRVQRDDEWSILYTYDDARQLIGERWLNADSQIVYDVTYRYDGAGNRIEKIERVGQTPPQRTEYSYDAQNRLQTQRQDQPLEGGLLPEQAQLPASIATFVGIPTLWWIRRRPRWLVMIASGFALLVPTVYLIQAQTDDATNAIAYAYDRNGNLIRETIAGGWEYRYGYDPFNRLVTIESLDLSSAAIDEGDSAETASREASTNPAQASILLVDRVGYSTSIAYDDLGRVREVRHQLTVTDTEAEAQGEMVRRFIYDAYGLVAIEDENGTQLVYNSLDVDDTVRVVGDDLAYWTLDDGLGRTQLLVDDEGAITDSRAGFGYNAFGEAIAIETDTALVSMADALTPANDALIEQIRLPESNIVLLGARAYHPGMGRFLQRDPVRHDSRGNLYTYVYNNPVTYADPYGTTPQTLQQAIEGLALDAPVIDPDTFIAYPTLPQAPMITGIAPDDSVSSVSVAQAQAARSQHIVEVSLLTQYGVNDTTLAIAPLACDIFVRGLNPQPDYNRASQRAERLAFAERFTIENGWVPSEPLAETGNPFHLLEMVAPLVAEAQVMGTMTGCQAPVSVPEMPTPNPMAFYDALDALYDETLGRPPMLYDALLGETIPLGLDVPAAAMYGVPDLWMPEIIVPQVIPMVDTALTDLQTQTDDLNALLLHPVMPAPIVDWQTQYSAQPVWQPMVIETREP